MRLMGVLLVAVGILLLLYVFLRSGQAHAQEAAKTFQNPILPGFHPDPSICRVGDDFYLTHSTFEYFPGLPIYHSRDLVHWQQLGNALDRPSQLPLKGATDTGGLYAPTIRYWKGIFYLTCDNVSGGGNFIVTAKDPAGPWSEPMWMNDFEIDGSMFFDDDGKAYYTRHAGGDDGIAQAEFDPATGKLLTPMKVIYHDPKEPWNEGPHLYKTKGQYYLMLAEGGTANRHAEFIARSSSPWGPFEPCPYNPILTERDDSKSPIQCTGHADLVEAPDGSWWAVFLGVRPRNGKSVMWRETFLAPVSWTQDGWPVVNGDHHVSLEMPAPKLRTMTLPYRPPRTDFSKTKLGPEWIHVRNADPSNFSLEHGSLRIKAAKETLSNKQEAPAFVGQRQTDFRVTARTAMEFNPTQEGEEAGLCVRANDNNHYEVGMEFFQGKTQAFLRNTLKGVTSTLARQPLESGEVQLRVTADENQYQFAWSPDGKTWNTLGASSTGDLYGEKTLWFTGAVIGLYASANGRDSDASADFAWFEMENGKAPAPIALSPRPTPVPPVPSDTWRVRSGGETFTDSQGRAWSADKAYEGGDTATAGKPVTASQDPELYSTERYGQDFSYRFPVPPGKYQVTLKFAETYVKKPGERVFDVLVNGKKVLDHFDILQETKTDFTGVDKTFKDIQPGGEGWINIHFTSEVQNAKVCAIEIARQK